MSSYANSVLVRGERVLYEGRVHWAIYLFACFMGVAGIVWIVCVKTLDSMAQLSIAYYLNQPQLLLPGYILIAGAVLRLARDLIRMYTTELVVTNSRVIAKFGIIRRHTYEILLPKVEGANIAVSVLGRIFGYGSLEIKGVGSGYAPIPYVADPFIFQRRLMELILDNESSNGTDGQK
jgi:uncharacterized membrane protein YdbT with pleckstrin-like domain